MSDIYRLAKPRKKGLLSLVFSRFFVIVLLLLAQVLMVLSFYSWLRELLPYFSVITTAFTLGGVIYLFNCDMDSSAKLTWMFIISILPITGAALLAFTQMSLGHRTLRRRVDAMIGQTADAIPQPPEVLERLRSDPAATDDLVAYMNRSGCFPAFENTETTYFPLGEDKFAAMLEELRRAEKSHYKHLIGAGVKIYEYTPGFVHAKVFVSDDVKAVVGTINLDYRSLYHHFECGTYLYKTDCIPDIERDFQATMAMCREVTPETIRDETLYYKLMGNLMKFFAPLM